MLALHRALLALRRRSKALALGGYVPITVDVDDVFAYVRFSDDEAFLIVLNLTDVARRAALPSWVGDGERILSTRDQKTCRHAGAVALRPNEGILVRLDRVPTFMTSTMGR